jgi:hypothetical protein
MNRSTGQRWIFLAIALPLAALSCSSSDDGPRGGSGGSSGAMTGGAGGVTGGSGGTPTGGSGGNPAGGTGGVATGGSGGVDTGGTGGVATGGTGGVATGGVGGTGGDLGAYPAGPYGRNIGNTFPNLAWQGYVNDTAVGLASAQPFVGYTMDDVRRSGKGYAIVHVSEFF